MTKHAFGQANFYPDDAKPSTILTEADGQTITHVLYPDEINIEEEPIAKAICSFMNDPPDTDFQRGYLAALVWAQQTLYPKV